LPDLQQLQLVSDLAVCLFCQSHESVEYPLLCFENLNDNCIWTTNPVFILICPNILPTFKCNKELHLLLRDRKTICLVLWETCRLTSSGLWHRFLWMFQRILMLLSSGFTYYLKMESKFKSLDRECSCITSLKQMCSHPPMKHVY
jgi:hypothetical protein